MSTHDACPDTGTCHHECPGTAETGKGLPCFRVLTCGPLSIAKMGDYWPDHIRHQHRLAAVTDEDLYDLGAAERRVIRGGAAGGWVGSPGQRAIDAVSALTGITFQGESVRGEPRAYWATLPGCAELAARLDALPRRRRS
jgi:hypothetical protein